MARTVFLILSLFGLAACDPFTGTLVVANMTTLIHGDKTLPDYVLSSQSKQNCSLLHAARNEEYCQDEPPSDTEALAALSANRYCYRTLGGIDCYDRPDFLASGQTRVNFAAGGYLPERNDPVPLELRDADGLAMAGIPAPGGDIVAAPPAPPVMAKAPLAPVQKAAKKASKTAKADPKAKEASTAAKTASKPAKKVQKKAPEKISGKTPGKTPEKKPGKTPEKTAKSAPKSTPKAAVQVSLNPPPPAATPTKAAELAQVPLLRAPEAKVAPLADLPGQGTY